MSSPEGGEAVPAALDGERVDRAVALVAGCSRAAAAALVADGAVQVDGQLVRSGSTRLREGQRLEVRAEARTVGDEAPSPDPDVPVVVRYEDDQVVVVDKAPGVVVHPGAGHEAATLVNGLLARYPELAQVGDPARPGIVHRLDVGTSGLLVVARTSAAYDALVADLAGRRVDRRYQALVWGHPEAEQGLVDAPIGRSSRRRTAMAVAADGREARTRYRVEARFDRPAAVALLACRLETGRTHQIRVHLAAIGHPVVGDERYRGVRPALEVPRPMLHAGRLGFAHPTRGGRVEVEAPLPADLVTVLSALEPTWAGGPGSGEGAR